MKDDKLSGLYYGLSFVLPAVIIVAALVGLKVAPFGDHTLLISDGSGLYVNYLSYVGRVVKGLEGITYSFEKSIGGNMMDSWGWFILNPSFVIFALFDITAYPIAYTYISILNLSACGTTMYILLKDIYGHKRSNLIFSTSYALNGFLVANVFQMNFFTGVFALPLMTLGLRRIFQNRRPTIYIISLAYSLFTNFYFGFMLCVASVFMFAVFFFVEGKMINNRKAVIVKYTLSSLIAGMLSSIVWLPAILALRGGRLDQTTLGQYMFSENMPFLEIGAKLFTGANSQAQLEEGLPNIYTGILTLPLVILFFINKKIDIKKKIGGGLLLGAYLASFYIKALDMLMHGGTTTNWFNYRYSFIFSFIILMIAAYEWQYFMDETALNLKRAAVILAVSTVIIFSKNYEFVNGGYVLADFMVLAIIFLAFWMRRRDPEKNTLRSFEMIVLIMVCVNLFLNYRICTKKILDWGSTNSEYVETVTPVSAMVEAIETTDSEFYRMELDEQRSGTQGNDTMLYGYRGVGHGGSDARNNIRKVLSQLGIRRFDMRTSYGKGIPASTDTLLGLKYIISKDDLVEGKGYAALSELNEWHIFKNGYALPIAVLAEQGISDIELDFEDVFDNLNKTWKALSGQDTNIFTEENDIIFIAHNMVDTQSISREKAQDIVERLDIENGLVSPYSDDSLIEEAEEHEAVQDNLIEQDVNTKELPSDCSYIEYRWTASQDGHVYSYNRSGMMDEVGATTSVMNYDGYYQKGETVVGYIKLTSDYSYVPQYMLEDVAGRFRAAYENIEVLQEISGLVRQKPAVVERVQENYLRGEFTAESGQLLFFTIPYDEGWTITIDGKKAELQQVMGAFMAAEVEPGQHSYELHFVPMGLNPAIWTALTGVAVWVCFSLFDSRKHKREQQNDEIRSQTEDISQEE